MMKQFMLAQRGVNTLSKQQSPAYRLALCAMMAAVAVVLMFSSSLIPILTYTAPILASLALLPVLSEFGRKYAWLTWGVAALLALLLCTDREAAFFFLFIGYYPIVKPALDRIPSKALRLCSKLALFTLVFSLLFILLTFVMGLEDMRNELLLSALVYFALIFIMLVYDRLYERLTILYQKKYRQKLIR